MLIPYLNYSQWNQIGFDIDGENTNDVSGRSIALSDGGNIIAVGANGNNNYAGHIRVFNFDNGSWNQIGLDIDGIASAQQFGYSLDLNNDGTRVASGAFLYGEANVPSVGIVKVYENISGNWVQLGNSIIGEAANDQSGKSVSINGNGNIVAIGAPYNNNNFSGHVRVYEIINGIWNQVGNDIDGENSGDLSGTVVNLNNEGNILAISAPNADGLNGFDTGHVKIYENISGNWQQIGSTIEGEAQLDNSGNSISLNYSGNIIAVGASNNDNQNGQNSGHVRVYENILGNWTQIGQDIDGEFENDYSGNSVSLNNAGNILAIGSSTNDGNGQNSGHVRVYKYESGTWAQVDNDIDGENSGDGFGLSVSLNGSGTILASGAWLNDGENGENSGHVRVFNNNTLKVDEFLSKNRIKFYPNPSNRLTEINFSKKHDLIELNIFDTLGKLILNEEYINTNKIIINTAKLKSGLYVVDLLISKNIKEQVKLIVCN